MRLDIVNDFMRKNKSLILDGMLEEERNFFHPLYPILKGAEFFERIRPSKMIQLFLQLIL